MTTPDQLSFIEPVRRLFEEFVNWVGFELHFAFVDATQAGQELTVRFRAEGEREYGAIFEVPFEIGDAKWRTVLWPEMEPASGIDDYVRWGILLPLAEEFHPTRDAHRLIPRNGVWWIDFRTH